jgi:outer membrane protein OmpA-like peptidoglycan-associated protein
MAALPPGELADVDGHKGLRLLYEGGSAQLPTAGETRLKALAEMLAGSDDRIQLKAYGGGSGDATSAARRLSLSRALAVRSFLIEQGIRSTRIDVRALGIARDGGPADRVDVLLLNR